MIDVRPGWLVLAEDGGERPRSDQVLRQATLKEALLALAKQDAGELFAIVDAARSETVLQKLALNEVEYRSLFQGGQAEEKYFSISPFLVRCTEECELLRWLTADVWGGSCGVFFTSGDSFVNLFTHFRRFLQIVTEAGQKLLFRFFDPRVLRHYLPTCTRAELEVFFGGATRFMMESEGGGRILSYRRDDPEAGMNTAEIGPKDSLGKLIVRQPQMEAFSGAAVRDFESRMVAHLRSAYPKECEKLGDAKTREAIRLGINRAAGYGIKSERGVSRYVDTMFEFGRDFDRDPDCSWAGRILRDAGIPDEADRTRQLRAAAAGHVPEAKGIMFESEA